MQLINKKFSLSKDYFRSSNQFCIIDINRDEIDELVTILDKELLICYQIGQQIIHQINQIKFY